MDINYLAVIAARKWTQIPPPLDNRVEPVYRHIGNREGEVT
jgi:hypothetical protein